MSTSNLSRRARILGPNFPGVLREHNPISWFHAKGIYRLLARLKGRLPEVGGSLFLTFTVDPSKFASPEEAFCEAREHLRHVFFRLRNGVEWLGKAYKVDAPYCVKVEFHANGWAHFHVVLLTRRYLPGELVKCLWGLGRTDVRRISDGKFKYLLKYVTKGGGLPEWVLKLKRVRIWQTTRGFYKPEMAKVETVERNDDLIGFVPKKRRHSSTIGERIERWRKSALLQIGDEFHQIKLSAPFCDLLAALVLPIALECRYQGDGRITINDVSQLIPWMQ